MVKDFDACEHKIRLLAIKAAGVIREIKGEPEEKNISVLYDEVAGILGLPKSRLSSKGADHLPAPWEMKDAKGTFVLPRKDCPQCGKVDSYVIGPICPKCKDSEDGKFRSGWKCEESIGGCGFVGDKSEKFFLQRMRDEFPEITIPDGSKQEIGIKTITDDGLK